MFEAHPIPSFTMDDVVAEWDQLAPLRYQQITSGTDVTFNRVLMPEIGTLLPSDSHNMIALDAGCGVGASTRYLLDYFKIVDGIDPSRVSIELARGLLDNHRGHISQTTVEAYSQSTKRRYNTIVANMVLMDTPNLSSFLKAVWRLLRPGGGFIFSITHPFFWPRYYGYEHEKWFSYERTLYVRAPFRISNDQISFAESTHVHRPLHRYVEALSSAGLRIDSLIEPLPAGDIESLYSNRWEFPRYLIIRCRRAKKIATAI
jgi:SAM-dependent methyltransferase